MTSSVGLRPPKDHRSISVNEASASSTSRRSIPTPFLRQPSVVEGLEKKQREGLKNRLKMLHTGVLPSRNLASTNLPVIVKAPVRKVTLPKNTVRKAHYRSVLALSTEPGATTEGELFRLTRRHSVSDLTGTDRQKDRSWSDSNGNESKSDRLSWSKYKNTDTDSRPKGDPDTRPRDKFLITKDDSHLDKESSVVAFLPISKSQSQILTNTATKDEFKETLNSFDAKMNGSFTKHNNDEEVFSLPSTEGDLDENLNIKQSSKDRGLKINTEKPDIDSMINGHRDVTTKPDRIEKDIVVAVRTQTNSERPSVTEDFLMTELHTDGNGETRYSEDKEPRSLFSTESSCLSLESLESSTLVDFGDSSSAGPSHNHDTNDENYLEKSQQHKVATTTFPDFGNSYMAQTEAHTTFEKVEDNKKVEERPVLFQEHQNAFHDNAISTTKEMTTNGKHDFSDDFKEPNKNDYKSENKTDNMWSTFEDSLTVPVQSSNKSSSEPFEVGAQKRSDTGFGKHDFSDELKELTKTDNEGKSEHGMWSTFEDSLTAPVKTTPNDFSENFKETNKNDYKSENKTDNMWSGFEDLLSGSVQTSNKSHADPFEVGAQKRPDTGLGKHDFSDELKELTKTDNEGNGKSGHGMWSDFDDLLAGPNAATSRKSPSNSIEVEVQKFPETGLVKYDFSDDLKELTKNNNESNGKSDHGMWSDLEDLLSGTIQTTPSKSSSEPIEVGVQKFPDTGLVKHDFSDFLKELSKIDNEIKDRPEDTLWSAVETASEPFEVVKVKKSQDTGLSKHNILEDLQELNKNDDKGEDKPDGFRSTIEDSFVGSVETTPSKSRSELIEVEVQKCPDAGLGFCIEGGKGSPLGDRPVTVKRVFNGK